MASYLAILDDHAYDEYSSQIAAGAVLPIDSYRSEEAESFAVGISRGGALYLACSGDDDEIWLVAVLESPEPSGLKRGDKRPPGWYAPANTTPVTSIRKLKKGLGLRGELGDALADPMQLTPKKEAMLRELLGESDAPVVGVIESAAAAPKLEGPPLARARAYLASGHVVAAIEALKEMWRAKRVPALADLIDRATRVAPDYDRPLFERRVADRDAASEWETRFAAGDPTATLAQLLQHLPVGGTHVISRRAKKLASLPEDPRLGRRLAELIPRGVDYFPEYWKPIIDIWLAGRDMRLGDVILQGKGQICGNTKQLLARAARPSSYFTKPPTLTAADLVEVEAIERELERLEEPLRLECDLVDAIAANPGDDDARLIYADRLQERGHPRGEYIALSCQKERGKLTPALARRLAALAELPYLAGPLDDLAAQEIRRQDRGIDRELQVSRLTNSITWLEVAAHPLARALERIEIVNHGLAVPDHSAGIAAVANVASRLARITGVGKELGKAVLARITDKRWKLNGGNLVRVL